MLAAMSLAGACPCLAQPAGNAANGHMLYDAKCGGCHSVDENRIGPKHRDVVGRRVASVAGYDYSDALKKLGGIWTTQRLDQWLQGPQAMAPGSKMFLSVSDAGDRRDIVAFLQSVSKPASK